MKIKTWKAWQDPVGGPHWTCRHKSEVVSSPVRIVPEVTWKKIMAVVKLADRVAEIPCTESEGSVWGDLDRSVANLREHERKRK